MTSPAAIPGEIRRGGSESRGCRGHDGFLRWTGPHSVSDYVTSGANAIGRNIPSHSGRKHACKLTREGACTNVRSGYHDPRKVLRAAREWVGMAKVGNSDGGARRPIGGGRAGAARSGERGPGAGGFLEAGTPSPELTAKLEPRKGPTKVPLNTRVLASTEARLNWLVNNRQSTVTNVVDVALQEFFDRYRVPPVDLDGRIAEQES